MLSPRSLPSSIDRVAANAAGEGPVVVGVSVQAAAATSRQLATDAVRHRGMVLVRFMVSLSNRGPSRGRREVREWTCDAQPLGGDDRPIGAHRLYVD
jgi:hypothetical protein